MRKGQFVLVPALALLLGACAATRPDGHEPAPEPGSKHALVLTLAPTDEAASEFIWLVSGTRQAVDEAGLEQALKDYAVRQTPDLAGLNAEKTVSGNRIGVRFDARAPFGRILQVIAMAARARIARLSFALLQDWNWPWHKADSGPVLWSLDDRFIAGDLPVDVGLSTPPKARRNVGVNVVIEQGVARFQLRVGSKMLLMKDGKDPSVHELMTEARNIEDWRRANSGLWSSWRDALAKRIGGAIRDNPDDVAGLGIGHVGLNTGDPHAIAAPAVYAYLVLATWADLNQRRSKDGAPALELSWAFGAASGYAGPVDELPIPEEIPEEPK